MTQSPSFLVSASGNAERPVVAITGWFRPAAVELSADGKALQFQYQPPFKLIRARGVAEDLARLEKASETAILSLARRVGRLGGFSHGLREGSENTFESNLIEIQSWPETISYWRDTAAVVMNLMHRIDKTRRRRFERPDRELMKQLNEWLMVFTHPVLEWASEKKLFRPRLHASGVLGAAALELLALAGSAGGIVPCCWCGEFFETDDGRRKFCDDCRESVDRELRRPTWKQASARYRSARKQARVMAGEGKSARQIASLQDRKVQQIRRWIKEA